MPAGNGNFPEIPIFFLPEREADPIPGLFVSGPGFKLRHSLNLNPGPNP
jgi:hypothetical protein